MNISLIDALNWGWGVLVVIGGFAWKEYKEARKKDEERMSSIETNAAAARQALAERMERSEQKLISELKEIADDIDANADAARTAIEALRSEIYQKFARIDDLKALETRIGERLTSLDSKLDKLIDLVIKSSGTR